MGMASTSSLLFTMLLALILSSFTQTTPLAPPFKEVKVGGDNGWHVPPPNDTFFYIRWASIHRLKVGDSLRFEYSTNDSVLVVDKWGYYHCNATNPYSSYKDGNTVVKLEKGGPIYFASGEQDHCREGQRLEVDVMDHDHRPNPPYTPPSIQTPAPSPNNSGTESVGLVNKLFSAGLVTAIVATIV